MECTRAKDLLSLYIDGLLEEDDRRALEQHLTSCNACAKELMVLSLVVKDIHSLGRIATPEGFMNKLEARIRHEKSSSFFTRMISRMFFPLKVKIPLEAAGLAAVAVIVFVMLRTVGPGGHMQTREAVTPEQAPPQAGQALEMPLTDKDYAPSETRDKDMEKQGKEDMKPLPSDRSGSQVPARDAMKKKEAPASAAKASAAKAPAVPVLREKSMSRVYETKAMPRPVPAEGISMPMKEEKNEDKAEMLQQSAADSISLPAKTDESTLELMIVMRPRQPEKEKVALQAPAAVLRSKALEQASQAADAGTGAPKESPAGVHGEEGKAVQARKPAGEPEAGDHELVDTASVKSVISSVSGTLVSSDCAGSTGATCLIVARVPGPRVWQFLTRLQAVSEFKMPESFLNEAHVGDVTVRISIRQK